MKTLKSVVNYIKKDYRMKVTIQSDDTVLVELPDKNAPHMRGDMYSWDSMVNNIDFDLKLDSDIKSQYFITPYRVGIMEVKPDLLYFTVTVEFYNKF